MRGIPDIQLFAASLYSIVEIKKVHMPFWFKFSYVYSMDKNGLRNRFAQSEIFYLLPFQIYKTDICRSHKSHHSGINVRWYFFFFGHFSFRFFFNFWLLWAVNRYLLDYNYHCNHDILCRVGSNDFCSF